MLSDYTDQLYKAHLYAAEPDRIRWAGGNYFKFSGNNHEHTVHKNGQGWECSCHFFQIAQGIYHACAHTISLERILDQKPELLAYR